MERDLLSRCIFDGLVFGHSAVAVENDRQESLVVAELVNGHGLLGADLVLRFDAVSPGKGLYGCYWERAEPKSTSSRSARPTQRTPRRSRATLTAGPRRTARAGRAS